MKYVHTPVMVKEVLKYLMPNKKLENFVFIDCTLGGGGHTSAIVKKLSIFNYQFSIIGIDQDIDAIKASKKRLKKYSKNITYINDNFKNIESILKNLKIKKVDAILIDLGVSTYQLENSARGFSFQNNSNLDMRMNKKQKFSAQDILNKFSEKELSNIFSYIGENPFAKLIASNIIKYRKNTKIQTAAQLISIIKKSTPPKWRYSRKKHFATNIFRALRIVVNDELGAIQQSISKMVLALKPGGRLVIITFHSLEDSIVKKEFKKLENPCTCPPKAPICACNKKPIIKVLTKKAILPSEKEISKNPKARSAQIRVAEKI